MDVLGDVYMREQRPQFDELSHMIPSQLTMHVDGLDPRTIVQCPTNLPTFALRDLVYEGCNINWLLAAEPRRVPKWRPFPIANCDGGESIKKDPCPLCRMGFPNQPKSSLGHATHTMANATGELSQICQDVVHLILLGE